jgi:hypothetical protein
MFRAAAGWGVLALALGLGACTPKKPANQFPPTLLDRAVVAADVGDAEHDFQPIGEAEGFSAEAPDVVAWVRVKNISKVCSLRWLWYDPDGKLYYDSDDTIVQPTGAYHPYVTAWYLLPVAGSLAADLPGAWRVVIQLNGSELAALRFRIEPRPQQLVGTGRKGGS